MARDQFVIDAWPLAPGRAGSGRVAAAGSSSEIGPSISAGDRVAAGRASRAAPICMREVGYPNGLPDSVMARGGPGGGESGWDRAREGQDVVKGVGEGQGGSNNSERVEKKIGKD